MPTQLQLARTKLTDTVIAAVKEYESTTGELVLSLGIPGSQTQGESTKDVIVNPC
jgi:hypothetical protein